MYTVSLIPGDGIGPELAESAQSVIGAINDSTSLHLDVKKMEAGDGALKSTGQAMPEGTLGAISNTDACLKAPVGESAADVIVVLRRKLDLYANVRPARSYPGMGALHDDIDLVIVRENTEDLYAGEEFRVGDSAVALRIITEAASERIARYAFEEARRRGKKKVTCVHKSNVMRITDGLFSDTCGRVASEYPNIIFEQMYVDACAMNMIRQPQSFDVIVTTNLFGDILSDESSQAAGGLGMAPAANIGDGFALFEPVHGAAFDIAGRGIANPSSFILSISMMLDWLSHKHGDAECGRVAGLLESTVRDVVGTGARTKDVGGNLTTAEFTGKITSKLI